MQIPADRAHRGDAIDRIRGQWGRELPALDTSPLETIGRILRIQFLAAPRIRKRLAAFDLELGALDVLATLRRSGAPYRMTPTQLYTELALTSGAITHRLDALEQVGLIERQADPADRRGTLAALTPKGRALTERALQAHLIFEAELVASLTKSEQTQLARLLQKILSSMETTDAEGQ